VGFRRRVFSAPLKPAQPEHRQRALPAVGRSHCRWQAVAVTNPGGQTLGGHPGLCGHHRPLRYSPGDSCQPGGLCFNLPQESHGRLLSRQHGRNARFRAGFNLVSLNTGAVVFSVHSPCAKTSATRRPRCPIRRCTSRFQRFTTPGEYELQVAGMGVSLPFLINDGIAMGWARTYAWGCTNSAAARPRRCHTLASHHAADHTAPAQVPANDSDPQFPSPGVASPATRAPRTPTIRRRGAAADERGQFASIRSSTPGQWMFPAPIGMRATTANTLPIARN